MKHLMGQTHYRLTHSAEESTEAEQEVILGIAR